MKNSAATKQIAYTGLMTAIVTVSTIVLGFRTGEFFINLGDTVIFLTAALFGPIPAMLAGGLGSFFADLAVYPATMWFTLVIKGLEGLICGLAMLGVKRIAKKRWLTIALNTAAMAISGAFMMTCYFICQTFIYGTYTAALIALPADATQAALSVLFASLLLYMFKLMRYAKSLSTDKTKTLVSDKPADSETVGAASEGETEQSENDVSER